MGVLVTITPQRHHCEQLHRHNQEVTWDTKVPYHVIIIRKIILRNKKPVVAYISHPLVSVNALWELPVAWERKGKLSPYVKPTTENSETEPCSLGSQVRPMEWISFLILVNSTTVPLASCMRRLGEGGQELISVLSILPRDYLYLPASAHRLSL